MTARDKHEWDSYRKKETFCRKCAMVRIFEGSPAGKRPGMFVHEYFVNRSSIGWRPGPCSVGTVGGRADRVHVSMPNPEKSASVDWDLDNAQCEVDGPLKMAKEVVSDLENAESCETESDFRSNVEEALSKLNALRGELEGLL